MALKSDHEFLRNVALGAAATALVKQDLAARGLRPIELERACTQTKLWRTRYRGLRVPDLLCLATGMRCEVRGKGALCIRMSDSPRRAERRWDAGLRARDLVAFVQVAERGAALTAAPSPTYFQVADLRASQASARVPGRKAPSGGAESSVSWPCTVPGADGIVTAVDATALAVAFADGTRRRYRLSGRHPYLAAGARFAAGATILAGVVRRTVQPAVTAARASWNASAALRSRDWIERWCGAKALPQLARARTRAVDELAQALDRETKPRVAIELAGALAQLGAPAGFDWLQAVIDAGVEPSAMLEAVLILAEVGGDTAGAMLATIAGDGRWRGQELRSAAIWGLGRNGCGDYPRLLPFLADDEEEVVLHALCGFGAAASGCADRLIAMMLAPGSRAAAACSAALERIGTPAVLELLVAAWRAADTHPWISLTVARLPEDLVRSGLAGHPLLARLEPLMLYRSQAGNWLARDATVRRLDWLARQASGAARAAP